MDKLVFAASLLLLLILNWRTSTEQAISNNSMTGVVDLAPAPPPRPAEPALCEQEVNAVNDLLRLFDIPLYAFDSIFSADDCYCQYTFCWNNTFVGCNCDETTGLCRVTNISLTGFDISGEIPRSIGDLIHLTSLAISDMGGEAYPFPDISNLASLEVLTLRNCSLKDSIPDYIWRFRTLEHLDLSFNHFYGELPPRVDLPSIKSIFLRSNGIDGPLPGWLKDSNRIYVYMNREELPYLCGNSSRTYYDNLHINCGGNSAAIDGIVYDADLDPHGGSTFFLSNNKAWAYSSMGVFPTGEGHNRYILNMTTGCHNQCEDLADLYTTARVSPISLKYYGFCLKNGHYTVELHFAEIGLSATRQHGTRRIRVFDVAIQGETVLKDFNIEDAAGGVNKAIIREFKSTVSDHKLEIHLYWSGKSSTKPNTVSYGPLISAISVSPVPKEHHKLYSSVIAGIVIGAAILAIALILALCWKLGLLGGQRHNHDLKGAELFPGGLLNFQQIKAATNKFNPENKIGEGGFGAVYKGVLHDGTRVAVKKLSAKSKQGAREFINEIGTIYALQHPNLVRIMGCCAEQKELLIVYEYMDNNSLEHALFGPEEVKPRLNWLTRVKICRDVAKGLAFLHEESHLKIIHRDIKPTNILLDKNFTAKISDFGYAELSEDEKTRVITPTQIAGTKGYMAPEYMNGYLTPKADVYSFGIVTLEIVSGMNISTFRPKDQNVYLMDTAYIAQQEGHLISLVDPSISSQVTYNEAIKLLNLAMECVSPAPKLRPSMSEVLKVFEGIVKVVEAKWKPKTASTGNPSSVDDSPAANPHFAFSHSAQSAGSTSQEGTSDATIRSSSSKEIDDSSYLGD